MALPLWRANLMLRLFGATKVPLIGHLRPRLVHADAEETVVRVPLGRRSRNHFGTMYFGALAVGADVAGGWSAMAAALEEKRQSGRQVTFVFKDARAEFLRRPDGAVHFTCRDGAAVRALVAQAAQTGTREEMPVHVVATVPSRSGEEPVALFWLTISLKAKP